jgi:hypothetical protein
MHETLDLDAYLYEQWQNYREMTQRVQEFTGKAKSHLLKAGQHELVLELGYILEQLRTKEKEARAEYDAF